MDFEKLMAEMAKSNDPREMAKEELRLMTEAYLDRMVKLTTIGANLAIIDPDAKEEYLRSVNPEIQRLVNEMEAAKAAFEKEHGEL